MKQTVNGTVFVIELNKFDSEFIKQIVYDGKTEVLSVILKNDNVYNYQKVPLEVFVEFSTAKSFGSFYNSEIKNKYKHMENQQTSSAKQQPDKINKASNEKRFIRMSIDVTKLDKRWFYKGTKTDAVYAKLTLVMLPDGEVDKFGNLGMIVQDVPPEAFKQDKTLRGNILGNGTELAWTPRQEEPMEQVSAEDEDIMEGLPF